jgi:hypothetical protein
MASGLFNQAMVDILKGAIDFDTDTLKVMLVTSSFVFDPDTQVVDTGGDDVNDPSYCEIAPASGYVGGFAGSGRKTVAVEVVKDDEGNLVNVLFESGGNTTWESVAAGVTVGGAILIKEATDDTDSRVIGWFEITDTATNGQDFVLAWNATYNIRLANVA